MDLLVRDMSFWNKIFNRQITESSTGGTSFSNKAFDRIWISKGSQIRREAILLSQIEASLREAELIVGFDFTKTNERTGRESFGGNSLHQTKDGIKNPYENIVSILGRITTPSSDMQKPVACYGFGDARTLDEKVFGFKPQNEPCHGFDEALALYRQIVPRLSFAEPISYAPMINKAISIAKENPAKQHVLVIISNGPVHRSQYVEHGQLSPQEQATLDAIKHAREYPSLSIVLIGVGDNSGVMTKSLEIYGRGFNNLQVVDYSNIMSRPDESKREMNFILAAMKKGIRSSLKHKEVSVSSLASVSSTDVSVSSLAAS